MKAHSEISPASDFLIVLFAYLSSSRDSVGSPVGSVFSSVPGQGSRSFPKRELDTEIFLTHLRHRSFTHTHTHTDPKL